MSALNGLNAVYWAGGPGIGQGSQVGTQIDCPIDIDYTGTAAPPPFTNPQLGTVSAIWTGWLLPSVTGSYTFTAVVDDQGNLTLDGNSLIAQLSPATVTSSPVTLTAGHFYPIIVSWLGDNVGPSQLILKWTPPSSSLALIPCANLFNALPVAPTLSSLTVNPANGNITLVWTATTAAAGYKVYRNGALVFDAGNVLTYVDTSGLAVPGDLYTIRAYDTGPPAWSTADSNAIAVPLNPPAAPTLSAVSGCFGGQAILSWTSSLGSGAQGYKLYKNGSLYQTFVGETLTYTDRPLPTGVAVSYRVTAYSTVGGESAQSTAAVVTPCLDVPLGLEWATGGACEGAQTSLSWAVYGALGVHLAANQITFNLYKNGSGTAFATGIGGSVASYLDSPTTISVPVVYRISVSDIWGNTSALSGPVTVTPCADCTCTWTQSRAAVAGNWVQSRRTC